MESKKFHYLIPKSLWCLVNQQNFVSLVWEEYCWITSIEERGTWEAFTRLKNRKKNRSCLIPCWDHTRVKLITNKFASSDYIHANHVDGYEDKKEFICTQVPKTSMLNDIWRMVWGENSRIIVMLLNDLPSDSHSYCQYWPLEDDLLQTSQFTIKKYNVEVSYSWTVTRLLLSNRYGLSREICHFLYTAWLEDAVPSDVADFYRFLQRLNQMRTATLRKILKLNQDPPGSIIVIPGLGEVALSARRIDPETFEEMELSRFTDGLKEILKISNSKGENFFHEVTRSGSFSLTGRFAPFIRGFHATKALNTRNCTGEMSIYIAAMTHEKLYAAKLIDTIVKFGADINGQEGIEGNTALHLAVNKQDYELVEWLYGQPDISLELRNMNNVSPFELATKNKDKKMVPILKKYYSSKDTVQVQNQH